MKNLKEYLGKIPKQDYLTIGLSCVVLLVFLIFTILSTIITFRQSFSIGGFRIYFYGILIALGMIAAFIVASILWKKKGYREGDTYWLLAFILPLALVGLRTFYIAFSPDRINFFDFRGGGLALYGGVIGGAIGILLYSWWRRTSPFAISDIILIGVILGQSIGRWGNFFNGEAYGLSTSGTHVPPFTVDIDGGYHLATFFYESVLNLIGFFVLWQVFKRSKKLGTTTACYFIWYGITRAIIEPLRLDSLMIGSGSDVIINRVSFLISLLLIVGGVVILLLNRKGWIHQEHANLLEINRPSKKVKESEDGNGGTITTESCGDVIEGIRDGEKGAPPKSISKPTERGMQGRASDSKRIEDRERDKPTRSCVGRKYESTDDDFPF